MPFAAALIGAGGSLLGGIFGGMGAQKAAKQQAQAEEKAIALQKAMFDKTQQNLAPFVGAGGGAIANINQGIGTPDAPGPWAKPFNPADLSQTPGYKFALGQGEQAIIDQSTATGGIGGGNTLKALMSFGTGLADQTFQQQFADYMAQQQQAFGQQYDIASLSENAAAGQGSIAANTGANIAGDLAGLGNAKAAGTVGLFNGISGGIGGLSQNAMLAALLNNGGGLFGAPTNYNGGNDAFTGPPGATLTDGVYMPGTTYGDPSLSPYGG